MRILSLVVSAAALFGLCGVCGQVRAQGAQQTGPYLHELIEKQPYRATWKAFVRGAGKGFAWLDDGGPASPSVETTVEGVRYVVAFKCKIHDCGDNHLYLVFWNGGRSVAGLVVQPSGKTFLGKPTPPQKELLLAAPAMTQ